MYLAEHEAYVIQNACTGQRMPGNSENRICGSDETLFVPYLQPLYSVAQDRIYGAEVLARKLGPCGKVHMPDEFIAAMEAERRISEVDYRMFEHACSILNLYETIRPDFRLSCNFSRLTLSDENFIRRIDETLQQTGADSRKLIFEITESSHGVCIETIEKRLIDIKSLGIAIALDDMGVEASNLGMLHLPQIDFAKIDRSLVFKAECDQRKQTVIEKLIEMCHRLGICCIAEGIETRQQADLLVGFECDSLQGYYIGKPLSVNEFFERSIAR